MARGQCENGICPFPRPCTCPLNNNKPRSPPPTKVLAKPALPATPPRSPPLKLVPRAPISKPPPPRRPQPQKVDPKPQSKPQPKPKPSAAPRPKPPTPERRLIVPSRPNPSRPNPSRPNPPARQPPQRRPLRPARPARPVRPVRQVPIGNPPARPARPARPAPARKPPPRPAPVRATAAHPAVNRQVKRPTPPRRQVASVAARPARPARPVRPATGPNRPSIPRQRATQGLERWQRELLQLVNQTRRAYRVPPVRMDATLNKVARRHNADQAFVMLGISHVGSDGTRVGARLRRAGYDFRYAAENVAAGQRNPKHVHTSFMKSPGHRKNVVNPIVQEIGIHVGRGYDGRLYWTQVFGKRK